VTYRGPRWPRAPRRAFTLRGPSHPRASDRPPPVSAMIAQFDRRGAPRISRLLGREPGLASLRRMRRTRRVKARRRRRGPSWDAVGTGPCRQPRPRQRSPPGGWNERLRASTLNWSTPATAPGIESRVANAQTRATTGELTCLVFQREPGAVGVRRGPRRLGPNDRRCRG